MWIFVCVDELVHKIKIFNKAHANTKFKTDNNTRRKLESLRNQVFFYFIWKMQTLRLMRHNKRKVRDWIWTPSVLSNEQSELIGQCMATPHHLSDVRRGAPSWIWDYFSHSDVTTCVLNAIYMLYFARLPVRRNWPSKSDCVLFKMFR